MKLPPIRRRNAFRRGSGLGLSFSTPELVSVLIILCLLVSLLHFSSCARDYSRAESTVWPNLWRNLRRRHGWRCASHDGFGGMAEETLLRLGGGMSFEFPTSMPAGFRWGTWHTLRRAQLNF